MTKCKICNGDPAILGEINSLIVSGVRQKLIHEQHPEFSIFQISRHNRCLAPNLITGELPPDSGGDELDVWRQRCTDAYHLAVANGDSRSAIAACSAATRQLTALAKKQEKEAAAKEKAVDPDSPEGIKLTVQGIDALLRHAARTDIQNSVGARCLVLLHEEPSFGELTRRIWGNRALLPVLLAVSAPDLLPQRPTTEEINAND